ncbi:tetratricopeptide repeat protein [Alteromonadaceae bacterium BrNp21-10]|nr:tetratricopeptide repeat protein [Alteromonadaceae bacterium BrNp21-10]
MNNQIWRGWYCIVVGFLSFSPAAWAVTEEQQVVKAISSLLQSNHAEDAFKLAQQHQFDYESLTDFDYVYGLAARAVGELDAAIFAFERVLQARPQSIDARFALALSYFDLGNIAAAKGEFELLASRSLPTTISARVERYLSRIQRLQQSADAHWQSWLQAGVGSDSNANNGVAAEFVDIPLLGQVRLFEQSRELDSSYFDIQAQATYIAPQNQHSDLFAAVSVLHAEYSEDLTWSRTFVNGVAGYRTLFNQFEVSGSVFYRPLWLDNDDYLDYYGAILGIGHPLSKGANWGLDLSIAQQAYQQQTSLDKDQLLVSLWASTLLNGGEHWFAIKLGSEGADESRFDFSSRDMLGVAYRWRQRLTPNWLMTLNAEYQDAQYNAPNPLFMLTREDKLTRIGLELSYRIDGSWSWNSQLMYLKNDSSIALYEYSRLKLWTGVRYDF